MRGQIHIWSRSYCTLYGGSWRAKDRRKRRHVSLCSNSAAFFFEGSQTVQLTRAHDFVQLTGTSLACFLSLLQVFPTSLLYFCSRGKVIVSLMTEKRYVMDLNMCAPIKQNSINGYFFHSKGGRYRVSCENNAISYKFLVFLTRP